jgi:hypothetical protein
MASVFTAGDVSVLREAIARVLEQPDRAAQMGQASREIIRKWNFEADRIGVLSALGRVVSIEKHQRERRRVTCPS